MTTTYSVSVATVTSECHDCGETKSCVRFTADQSEPETGYRDEYDLCSACFDKREGPFISADEACANAAPELLRELEAGHQLILKSITHVTHGKPTLEEATAWLKVAEAAIRKAKGESQ